MSKKASSSRIGAFVIGAIVLVTVVIAIFGTGRVFTQMEHYVVYFQGSAAGLDKGSPVKLKGVKIGEVTDVTAVFADNWEFYVEVIIETDNRAVVNASGMEGVTPEEEITALIARGLRAQLETQSMVLGQKYVKLDLFPDSELRYQFLNQNYPEIPSIPTVEEQIGVTLSRLVDKIDDIPIAELSQATLSLIQGVDSLVHSQELRGAIVAIERVLNETSVILAEVNEQIGPVSADVAEVTAAMTGAIAAADTLLVTLRGVTVENQGDVYTAVKELSEVARSLRNLLDYLQRHPDAIIWGKD
jgi:paraquat-inducible protein B